MTTALRLLNSLPVLYLIMLWPGRFAVQGLFEEWYYPQMMYDTGVWSVRLLMVTIAVSPTLVLINRLGRGRAFGKWLLQRRRHFGLGSFIYAALHLVHYVLETADLTEMAIEFTLLEYLTGWLAFVIFAALALTSNNWAARLLGPNWKRLHYWVYPAAALTFWHWYLLDFLTERVLFWIAIFIGIKAIHTLIKRLPRKRAAA
ncbi:ferric reductase-like transmembrane domain-containing protein [Rhodobacteraceae bacterium]|nr:ferric reductase-like transmembrane domain-containing protein [Paracoccaceae bacterium]